MVAIAWGLFYPRPYVAALLVNMGLPMVGLVLLRSGQGLYSVDRRGNDSRPSVASALFLPGMVIMVRALLDLNLVAWRPLGIRSALVALLLAWLVVWSDSRLPRRAVVIVAVFFLAYTMGSLALINCWHDGSTPQLYRAQVLQKRPASYRLILGSWASQPSGSSVKVSRQVFEGVHEGQQVLVLLYAGKLRVPWFTVAPP